MEPKNRKINPGSNQKRERASDLRSQTIKVCVTEKEKVLIQKRADATGNTASNFCRQLALNEPIRSVVDLKAVADLAKVNGDMGRIAGLLKLWLVERKGKGDPAIEIERMIILFREGQQQMTELMGKVIDDS